MNFETQSFEQLILALTQNFIVCSKINLVRRVKESQEHARNAVKQNGPPKDNTFQMHQEVVFFVLSPEQFQKHHVSADVKQV